VGGFAKALMTKARFKRVFIYLAANGHELSGQGSKVRAHELHFAALFARKMIARVSFSATECRMAAGYELLREKNFKGSIYSRGPR
jgi:ribosomal protein L40E